MTNSGGAMLMFIKDEGPALACVIAVTAEYLNFQGTICFVFIKSEDVMK